MAATTHELHVSPGRGAPVGGRKYVWQIPIRLTHWVNVAAIFVLFVTGLYMSSPMITSPGETWRTFFMGKMHKFHFAFGMVLAISLFIRLYWFLAGNNYARSGVPMFWKKSWYKAVFAQVFNYLRLQRGHVHIGHNSLAGVFYFVFLMLCGFQAATGFALYGESTPGGFWDHALGWVLPLLGGSFRVHMWHNLASWLTIVFVLFHVYIVLYDVFLYQDGLVDSIIAGPKWYEEGDHDADTWIS